LCFFDFIEPSVQCGFERRLVLVSPSPLDELLQGAPGDDPHAQRLYHAPKLGASPGAMQREESAA
jgi:hypothetical protein